MNKAFWLSVCLGLASVGENFASEASLRRLTLVEAENIALQKHPKISAAELRAFAAKQTVKEVRSALFPTVTANVTAAGADSANTRIGAGGLNNPSIFDRNAEGITINQILTDFGRSGNLTESARLRSRAEEENSEATRDQVLLQVNTSYFSVLEAESVLRVAEQTAKSRELLLRQIESLATNKLKSDLDVSFAKVDYEQARLLLAKAQNDLKAGFATLSTLLGEREATAFQLVDEPMPPDLTNDVSSLVFQALQQRPELVRLRLERDAAREFAKAERKLSYPTISAVATGGVIPVGDSRLPDRYGAAGVNLSLPLFSGGLYSARRKEADLRAKASEEALRDEEDNVTHDVQVTKLNVDYAFERLALTEKLLRNARQAFGLAQTRFNLGSSSIVELSQAELNRTTAEIARANAVYDYHLQRATLEFQVGNLRPKQ